jgi:hypothetical protein
MGRHEIAHGGDWIRLNQEGDHRRTVVNTVMTIQIL